MSFLLKKNWMSFLKTLTMSAFVIVTLTQAIIAWGSYSQNNQLGYYLVDFNGTQQGIVADATADPAGRANISVDTVFGVAQITSPASTGHFTTNPITPSSFSDWDKITLGVAGVYDDATDVTVTLYDCGAPAVAVPGFSNMTLTASELDISSLSANDYACLNVTVTLNDVGTLIDTLRVDWDPLPQYIVALSAVSPVQAGDYLNYSLNYSVSYVDDVNTVIWVELPTLAGGTVTGNTEGQTGVDIDPVFSSATNGGVMNSSGSSITVNGITVPDNAIYWDLGNLAAGVAGTINFKLKTIIGSQNGIVFSAQAHMDSTLGNQLDSDSDNGTVGYQPTLATLASVPMPILDKTVAGTVDYAGNHYVEDTPPYSPIITYTLTLTDQYALLNRETIFDPIIVDDLSDIITDLNTNCPGGATGRIDNISNGESLVGSTITWDPLADVPPGTSISVSYTVDYTNCSTGAETYDNSAQATANNVSTPVTDTESVIIGVDLTIDDLITNSFAKGDKVRGNEQISGNNTDDNALLKQSYGDTFSYAIKYDNGNFPITQGRIVMSDRIDDAFTFVSATLPAGVNGTVYYTTNTSATVPAHTINPGGTGLTAAGGWTTTVPSPVSDVKSVAFFIPCLDSSPFPAPGANVDCNGVPTSVKGMIQVTIDDGGDVCALSTVTNIGNISIHAQSNNIVTQTLVDLGTPVTGTDDELTHIGPKLANFTSSTIGGPQNLNVGITSANYTVRVKNTGAAQSATTTLSVTAPTVLVNNVSSSLQAPVVTQGGVPTYTGNDFTVAVGSIAPGNYVDVKFTYYVPIGIKNLTTVTIAPIITFTDANACDTAPFSPSIGVTIHSREKLKTFKSVDESIIAPGGDIHYDITYRNLGTAPTTSTYVVDHIPVHSTFKYAYTTGTDATNTTYTCTGCTVLFSNQAIPASLSVTSPFVVTDIASFAAGTEVNPLTGLPQSGTGVWASPYGVNTTFVAWLVSTTGGGAGLPAVLPAGPTGQGVVGLTVTNDDNGPLPGTAGSAIGTFISNAPAILSSELPQAIDNQVITTILPDPGLRMTKESYKSGTSTVQNFVTQNETFDWNIEYYNDSGNDDTDAVIIDTYPVGVTVSQVWHTWNLTTTSNPSAPTVSAGAVDITSLVTIDTNARTITIDIVALRGQNLHYLEGGTIRLVTTTASSGLNTGDRLTNNVDGVYSNATTTNLNVHDDDWVDVKNPDLWIIKTVNQTSPLIGETVGYTLTVINMGEHAATGVLISDTLPLGLCYTPSSTTVTSNSTWIIGEPTSITYSGTDCTDGTTTLEWDSVIEENGVTAPGFMPALMTYPTDAIAIHYDVTVDAVAVLGVALTNGAHIESDMAIGSDVNEDYNGTDNTGTYPNDDTEDVTPPRPDPYVQKDVQLIVEPDDVATFTITYGNLTRQPAQNVYLIDTLPDHDNNGTPDMKLDSPPSSTPAGDEFYYHECNGGTLSCVYSATPPVFNPLSPTSGGWSASSTGMIVGYIAILHDGGNSTLLQSETVTVSINLRANDPDTDIKLGPGLSLTNKVKISSADDAVSGNNDATATTHTPGLDLYIEKSANHEGAVPGIALGTSMTYTIEYGNSGIETVCGVNITDVFGTGLLETTPVPGSFAINLTNAGGATVYPQTLAGTSILTPVNFTLDSSSVAGSYRWNIGSSATDADGDICIPPGAHGTFTIYGIVTTDVTVRSDGADGNDRDDVTNTATIGFENFVAVEDITENNMATTNVVVYQPDVKIDKTGYSCGPDTTCANGTGDDSWVLASLGEKIHYDIPFQNIGNIPAENVIISEDIPANTCFIKGQITGLPNTATVEYSDDGGNTWTYSPIGASGATDCAVTNFRVKWNIPLESNRTSVGEVGSLTGFTGTQTQIEDATDGLGTYLNLSEFGFDSADRFTKLIDLNDDGKNDLIAGTDNGIEYYLNTSTSSLISFSYQGIINMYTYFDIPIFDTLNGDTKPDMLLLSQPNSSYVFVNTSTSSTISFSQYETISGPPNNGSEFHYVYEDLGGNASKDLVLTGYNSGTDLYDVYVYQNIYSGSGVIFDTTPLNFTEANTTSGISAHDLDADGDLDLLFTGNPTHLYENTSAGTLSFGGQITPTNSLTACSSPYQFLSFGNYDSDTNNLDDIFCFHIYKNTSDVTPPLDITLGQPVGGFSSQYATSYDLDGDTDLDILATGAALNSTLVLPNTSTGPGSFLWGGGVLAVIDLSTRLPSILKDFNLDGLMDVLSPSRGGSSKVSKNTSTNIGPFQGTVSFDTAGTVNLVGPLVFATPVTEDISGDGLYDIILPDQLGDTRVYKNTTDDSNPSNPLAFSLSQIIAGPTINPYTYNVNKDITSFGYINGDNKKDLVLPSDSSLSRVYQNTTSGGTISFSPTYYSSGSYTYPLGIGSQQLLTLQVTQTVPTTSALTYEILDGCGGSSIYGPVTTTSGIIDISTTPLSSSPCLKVNFTNTSAASLAKIYAWNILYNGTIAPIALGFNVQVKSSGIVGLTIPNTVSISTTSNPELDAPIDCTTYPLSNNCDTYILGIAHTDLEVTKSVDKVAAAEGDPLLYTMTVTNHGPQAANNFTFNDTPPASIDAFVWSGYDAAAIDPNFGLNYYTDLNIAIYHSAFGKTVYCPVGGYYCDMTEPVMGTPTGSLGAGDSVIIYATVNVTGSSPGDILLNMVDVTTTTYEQTIDLGNNHAEASTVIGNLANVYINKSGPATATINSTFTYTINYGNNGNVTADNVTIVDTLDSDVQFFSAVQTAGSTPLTCTNTSGSISCVPTAGGPLSLAAGATGSITITVTVPNNQGLLTTPPTNIHNLVTITTTTTEITNGANDNFDTVDTSILPNGLGGINGFVFKDLNSDEDRDAGEGGISGVSVFISGRDLFGNIFGPNKSSDAAMYETMMAQLVAEGILGPSPTSGSGGVWLSSNPYPLSYFPIASQTTYASFPLGGYSFTGLSAGTYFLEEVQPTGYNSTGSTSGTQTNVGTGLGEGHLQDPTNVGMNQIIHIGLGDGSVAAEYNFGEKRGEIGDQVFLESGTQDGIFNGSDTGIANVEITLYIDTANYGVLDAGEVASGVTTLTASDGTYLFSDLNPALHYIVKVTDSGNVLTTYNAEVYTPASTADNYAKDPQGYAVDLSSGPSNLTADFGYKSNSVCVVNCGGCVGPSCNPVCTPPDPACTPTETYVTIGDQVFWDKDKDGIFNNADQGIPGVSVELWIDVDNSGTLNTPDTMVGTTAQQTNGVGYYSYGGLAKNKKYIVKVSTINPALANFIWKAGPNPGVNNNSQSQVYPINITTASNDTADFGYTGRELVETGADIPWLTGLFGAIFIGLLTTLFIRLRII